MDEVIIVGAEASEGTIYWQCVGDYGYQRHWTIKGFLDDRPNILEGFGIPARSWAVRSPGSRRSRNLHHGARRARQAPAILAAFGRQRRVLLQPVQ
jgi:hypothetical protein